MEPFNFFGVEVTDIAENVVVTVEEHEVIVRKKPYMAKLYRRKGLARYKEPDGSERLSDNATFDDHGPDGVSRSYTLYKDIQPTEEEREAGRRHIQEVTVQALIAQGIW